VEGLLPALALLLVFAAGYAVQRGSICAVAAVDAVVAERRWHRFFAFLVCAAIALAVMAAAALAGVEMLDQYRGSTAVLAPALGGALFGAGAWVNGRCAFGTIAGLGSGELARIGTLAGLFGGFAFAGTIGLQGPALELSSPLFGQPAGSVLAGAVAAAVILISLARGRADRRESASWPPLAAMIIIGLVNGVLLVIAAGWPYTNLLMDLARSSGMTLAWRSAMAATFVLGAVAGAVVGEQFRAERGTARRWARGLFGGALMGVGATLVPGGNDTMLLVGLPLLLPNLVVAYAAMTLAMLAIAAAGRVRSGRAPR
jgi:uncharacterized protein